MKTALITGAGSGIGQATALEFAKHGYQVILIGRNLDKLKKTQTSLPESAAGHLSISADLSSKESLQNLLQSLTALTSTIDVLVNNAGIYRRNEALAKNGELWSETFAINFFGTVALTEAILPKMIYQKAGSIVNVSSTLAIRPVAGTAIYSASKAALQSWSQTLAIEAAPHGIRVNSVSPGIIDTPIHPFHHLPDADRATALTEWNRLQPMGRIGHPEDVAKAIYFLASEQSSWTTGTNVTVDGGINLI